MNLDADHCFHLTVDILLQIHTEAITRFGGITGVRAIELLESAIAAPQAGFGGKSVYSDTIEIAGAYLYYLCSNHPFLDGNKRAALGACLVFLRLNQIPTQPDGEEWERLTLGVAAGELDRAQTTAALRLLLA